MTTRALWTKTHAIVRFSLLHHHSLLIYIRSCPYVFVDQIKKERVRAQANYVNDSFQGGQIPKRITENITRVDTLWRVSSYAFTLSTLVDIVDWRWLMYLNASLAILQQNKITNKNAYNE